MPDSTSAPYAETYDLSNCDAEPVHLIRHFQLSAFLLVVDAVSLQVVAHSDNFSVVAASDQAGIIGASLAQVLGEETAETIQQGIASDDTEALNPLCVRLPQAAGPGTMTWNLILRKSGKYYLLEFEDRDEGVSTAAFFLKIELALQRIQSVNNKSDLLPLVTTRVRELTGYDRVMLYRFDEEYNGEVIAEAKKEELPTFLHLRYPHTDIPSQVRALLLRNHIRHIVSTEADSVSSIIFGPDLKELDLSLSINRGSSPIHLEYLRNMGVGASLTIAIIVNQQLWGLFACHHGSPKLVDFRLRSMISLMGKVLSGRLALHQAEAHREQVRMIKETRSRLFDRMNTRFDIVAGLLEDPAKGLLRIVGATGVAALFDGEFHTLGLCPKEEELRLITSWLGHVEGNVFTTQTLFKLLPEAKGFANPPAGLMVMRLGRSPEEYIFWFRPEVIKTINWGGKPDQRKFLDGGRIRLHPNLSFQKWEQRLAGTSEKWEEYQQDAVINLRNDIKEIMLKKYQEVRRQNGQLVTAYEEMESFSYTVSHDLKAPLRHIKGFAEILQEDYYDGMAEDGRMAIDTILTSVGRMTRFINDILEYSRLGRSEPAIERIDLKELTEHVWADLVRFEERSVEFSMDVNGAILNGDRVLIQQLVYNLLSNAVKYTRKQEKPSVSVRGGNDNGMIFYVIADNGIGIDMKHADRVFDVFSRLVSADHYEGTGIGLSTVKRIVDKHGGRISLQSSPGQGAAFTVNLPADLPTEAPI